MYLEHFKFKELPFGLTPNLALFCNLKGHEEALNVLLFSIRSGEGFIKIIGEVGSGKTLLCRKLMDSLSNEFITAYLPNPDLSPIELRRALARELGIDLATMQDQHELVTLINNKLLELHNTNKAVVLLIDEAQALSREGLETLRLLTNIETEKKKLLQIVLFGQPELDTHLASTQLRQLQQRITFSYYLPLLSRDDLDMYLFHRLAIVGNTSTTLFAKKARDLLYRVSKGVPRIVNILCHKALLTAYGRGEFEITRKTMLCAINDTEFVHIISRKKLLIKLLVSLAIITGLFFWLYKGMI